MDDKFLRSISKKAGIAELGNILIDKLKLPDLQSLLMHVYKEKTSKLNSSHVYNEYKNNHFVKPSSVKASDFISLDQKLFAILPDDFETIVLSPLAPLGNCSVLAGVPQNLIVTTSRNTEVLADGTNLLALECARRREEMLKKENKSVQRIKLATSCRHTRTQSFEGEGFSPHFSVFALTTAGRDEGSLIFETDNLNEHIRFYLDIFEKIVQENSIKKIDVVILDYNTHDNEKIFRQIQKTVSGYKKAEVIIRQNSVEGKNYYTRLRFSIYVTTDKDETHMYTDGGFVNWTAKLLGNNKERLLTSAIGTEYLLKTIALK